MTKEKLLTLLLVVSVIFAILFVNADKLLHPSYVGQLLKAWGDNPFPDPLGGYKFGEKFNETAKASLHLLGFPLRIAYWIAQQTYTFFRWSSNPWLGAGASPGGGINGGVVQG